MKGMVAYNRLGVEYDFSKWNKNPDGLNPRYDINYVDDIYGNSCYNYLVKTVVKDIGEYKVTGISNIYTRELRVKIEKYNDLGELVLVKDIIDKELLSDLDFSYALLPNMIYRTKVLNAFIEEELSKIES